MKLASIFSEHLMLQRDKEVYIFGETEKDEEITVTIDDIAVTEKVSRGAFRIKLPAHKAGGPYTLKVQGVSETLTVEDVLYGEVWLANGQSNIELELQGAKGGLDIIDSTDDDMIRYYNVPKAATMEECEKFEAEGPTWHLIRKGEFKDISAIGYYFANVISKELGVPVGIVDCYRGGSSVTCWLKEEILHAMPEGNPYFESYDGACKDRTDEEYEAEIVDYDSRVAAWCEREAEVHKTDPELVGHDLEMAIGNFPWPPPMGYKSAWRPCGIYYSMLERIIPFAFKGVLYYQGEEDAPRYSLYANLLKALIKELRDDFMDEGLPFVDLQLPMWIERTATENREWGGLRQAQQRAVDETENTYLTVLLDCGEVDNIHPVDKKTPGERLALNVLEWIYNSDKGDVQAEFDGAKADGSSIILSFKNTCGELKTADNELIDYRDENPEGNPGHIYGFEIKTDGDELAVPESRIEGDTIVLTSADGKPITYVQYGFFNYGKVNVYNAKNMPLAPFAVEI